MSEESPRPLPVRWLLVTWVNRHVAVQTAGQHTFPTRANPLVATAFKQAAQ